jgi:hypothetical protein
LLILQNAFDFLIVDLSFLVIVLPQYLFDLGFDDPRKVRVELIVFGEHCYFAVELLIGVLSLEEFLAFIVDLVFLILIGGPGLMRIAWLFQFHDYVDVGNEVVGLVGGMLGHEGLAHHHGQTGALLLSAK